MIGSVLCITLPMVFRSLWCVVDIEMTGSRKVERARAKANVRCMIYYKAQCM